MAEEGRRPGALERLAVAQALYKAVAGAVSTKDARSLRRAADAELEALHTSSGADRVAMRVNGHDVGTLSVRYSKATEGPEVKDQLACERWLADGGHVEVELRVDWLTPNQRDRVERLMRDMNPSTVIERPTMPPDMERGLREGPGGRVVTADGEVVPGMEWVRRPKAPVGTTVRGCEPEDVAEALGDALPGAVMALLADGGEVA